MTTSDRPRRPRCPGPSDRGRGNARAIRSGEVDALVVQDASADAQVFTLSSAEGPYRMFVENMRDGAATLSETGIVLYANLSLARLLALPLAELIGSPIAAMIAADGIAALDAISGPAGGSIEVDLISSRGDRVRCESTPRLWTSRRKWFYA